MINDYLFAEVNIEIDRQNALWGVQNYTPEFWLSILMEEVGEVAKEINDGLSVNNSNYRTELVQVMSVVAQMIAHYDRTS